MKYVFVGDIHGRVEDVERALGRDGLKVFVGDFVDSYNRVITDQRKCLDLVLDAIDRGEARAIFGNHELSYLRQHHRCSGWNGAMHHIMQEYRDRIMQKFEPFVLLEDRILVTHAGLTGHIWERFDCTLDNIADTLRQWWPQDGSPMHWIGGIRGGSELWGGPFWCHFPNEFKPVEGLVQIFGHTSGYDIRSEGINYCIDNSRRHDEMDFLTMEIE